MPAGFLVLPDGRCFSARWWAHDQVLHAVALALEHEPEGGQLLRWLLDQLPGPNDEEEIGYGAWLRGLDGKVVVRYVDLRLFPPWSQQQFCRAAIRAASVEHEEDWLNHSLSDLADMVHRYEGGEPPLSRSDWRDVVPPDGERINLD